jgi:hypothetical protein
MALAQAAAAVDPGDGITVGWSLADLKSAIKRCNSFKCMGVVLAWWLIAGRSVSFLDQVVAEFTRPWIVLVAKHRSAHSRRRGVTFPLRRGELHELVEVFAASSLASLAAETSANLWGSKAWAYLTMCALNHLAGFNARLEPGRWTAPELSVFSSVLLASERRCASDVKKRLAARKWGIMVKSSLLVINSPGNKYCRHYLQKNMVVVLTVWIG